MVAPEIKLKQYVFIPKSLNMSVGKAASQVAHATFLALEHEDYFITQEWKEKGMCVIVLEAENPQHLNNISSYLSFWDIINHNYIDEGLTEVLPMTPTALATGIVPEDKFWMFEQFKLFGSIGDAQEIVDESKTTIIKHHPIRCCWRCIGTGETYCSTCGSYIEKGL